MCVPQKYKKPYKLRTKQNFTLCLVFNFDTIYTRPIRLIVQIVADMCTSVYYSVFIVSKTNHKNMIQHI